MTIIFTAQKKKKMWRINISGKRPVFIRHNVNVVISKIFPVELHFFFTVGLTTSVEAVFGEVLAKCGTSSFHHHSLWEEDQPVSRWELHSLVHRRSSSVHVCFQTLCHHWCYRGLISHMEVSSAYQELKRSRCYSCVIDCSINHILLWIRSNTSCTSLQHFHRRLWK